MTKYLHYCWFGNAPIPKHLIKCINTWHEKMPDWEIIEWNEEKFDITSTKWTKSAYDARKFAFVSDYVRLTALHEMGGIYLDTDVKLLRSLDDIYNEFKSFGGFENDKYLTSAVLAAEKGHPLISEFIRYYDNMEFTDDIVSGNVANVIMMTEICRKFGLLSNDKEQSLSIQDLSGVNKTFHVFPKTYFCPMDFYHNKNFTKNTHAIHLFDASWLNEDTKKRITKERKAIFKVLNRAKGFIGELLKNK